MCFLIMVYVYPENDDAIAFVLRINSLQKYFHESSFSAIVDILLHLFPIHTPPNDVFVHWIKYHRNYIKGPTDRLLWFECLDAEQAINHEMKQYEDPVHIRTHPQQPL